MLLGPIACPLCVVFPLMFVFLVWSFASVLAHNIFPGIILFGFLILTLAIKILQNELNLLSTSNSDSIQYLGFQGLFRRVTLA